MVDTSGSISDEDILNVASEIKGVTEQFQDYEIHFIQGDTRVTDYTVISPFEGDIPRKFKGRGGTSFTPLLDFAKDKDLLANSAVFYFTDGYPDKWPDDKYGNITWVITTDIEPPWGDFIHYDRERD